MEERRREWEETLSENPDFAKLLDLTFGIVVEHDWNNVYPDSVTVGVFRCKDATTGMSAVFDKIEHTVVATSDPNIEIQAYHHPVGDTVTYEIFRRLVLDSGRLLHQPSVNLRAVMNAERVGAVAIADRDLARYYDYTNALEIDRVRPGDKRREILDGNIVRAAILKQVGQGKLPYDVALKIKDQANERANAEIKRKAVTN